MAKQKEEIKFVVVQHYSGNKTLKDLLENLIRREITHTSKKSACSKQRKKNEADEKTGIASDNNRNKQYIINADFRDWNGVEIVIKNLE